MHQGGVGDVPGKSVCSLLFRLLKAVYGEKKARDVAKISFSDGIVVRGSLWSLAEGIMSVVSKNG